MTSTCCPFYPKLIGGKKEKAWVQPAAGSHFEKNSGEVVEQERIWSHCYGVPSLKPEFPLNFFDHRNKSLIASAILCWAFYYLPESESCWSFPQGLES